MAESDDNNDIYINQQDDFIKNELITYLENKKIDKKISIPF
jgi:hypothetical protein